MLSSELPQPTWHRANLATSFYLAGCTPRESRLFYLYLLNLF